MKNILLLLLTLSICYGLNAQSISHKENIQIVANMVNDAPIVTTYLPNQLNIKNNIAQSLKLNQSKLTLENPRIFNELGKGWYLQYTFKTANEIGLYKERLSLKDNQLVITESRSAIMAKANNCKKIVLTKDKNRCSCAVKRDYSKPSEATYRLFTQVN